MRIVAVFLLFPFLVFTTRLNQNGTVWLKLTHFRNIGSKLSNGHKCEVFWGSTKCDTKFIINVSTKDKINWTFKSKVYGEQSEIDREEFMKDKQAWKISMTNGQQFDFNLKVTIYDEDKFSVDQLIAIYEGNMVLIPHTNGGQINYIFAPLQRTDEYKTSENGITFEMEVGAQCSSNYYGSSCMVHCERGENNICDENGNQVCTSGHICYNAGQCVPIQSNKMDNFSCQCAEGWTGSTCETIQSPCYSSPCHNGASCYANIDHEITCGCLPGWEGTRCQLRIPTTTTVIKTKKDRVSNLASSPGDNGSGLSHDLLIIIIVSALALMFISIIAMFVSILKCRKDINSAERHNIMYSTADNQLYSISNTDGSIQPCIITPSLQAPPCIPKRSIEEEDVYEECEDSLPNPYLKPVAQPVNNPYEVQNDISPPLVISGSNSLPRRIITGRMSTVSGSGGSPRTIHDRATFSRTISQATDTLPNDYPSLPRRTDSTNSRGSPIKYVRTVLPTN